MAVRETSRERASDTHRKRGGDAIRLVEEETADAGPLRLRDRRIVGYHARADVKGEVVDVIGQRYEPRGAVHAPHPRYVKRLDVRQDGAQERLPCVAGQTRHRIGQRASRECNRTPPVPIVK